MSLFHVSKDDFAETRRILSGSLDLDLAESTELKMTMQGVMWVEWEGECIFDGGGV